MNDERFTLNISEEDRKTLEMIREQVQKQTEMITYRFGEDSESLKRKFDGHYRKPNLKELKQHLRWDLHSLYFQNGSIKRSTYYSLKGQIRRGQFDRVLNFTDKYDTNIRKNFKEYQENEHVFYAMKIPVTFQRPVKVGILDIDIQRKEAINAE